MESARCVHGVNPPSMCEHCGRAIRSERLRERAEELNRIAATSGPKTWADVTHGGYCHFCTNAATMSDIYKGDRLSVCETCWKLQRGAL